MIQNFIHHSIITLLLLLICNDALARRVQTTIPLEHAPPAQVVELVEKKISSESSVTYRGHNIVLDVTDKELKKIEPMIRRLDENTQPLLFSVSASGVQRVVQQPGSQKLPSNINLPNLRKPGGLENFRNDDPNIARLKQQALSNSVNTSTSDIPRIKESGVGTVKGASDFPVFIHVGNKFYASFTDRDRNNRYEHWIESQAGFYALATVKGKYVTVEVARSKNAWLDPDDRYDIILSRNTGRMGEWIALGTLYDPTEVTQQNLYEGFYLPNWFIRVEKASDR